ncbi:hypothetical protein [Halorussus amylolyticus]|uniref:hypothetical protein n=1 Tax=Halorussus amylolyticus TaxID=1126242 RepID=UPI001043F9FD|nr:hypothetical protein [Halorussus amylolyticus]
MVPNNSHECEFRYSDMTAENTDSPTDETRQTPSTGGDSDAGVDSDADRIEALESSLDALADRVAQLERNLAWIARQQARETGNGVCPECDTGGGLTVERSPSGKKRVTCSRCEETFD